MSATPAVLAVSALDVYYGRAHALQDVSLTLERGVLAVVGRNGMGKTTLCNAIMGLVASRGSVKLHGEEIRGLTPNRISDKGIGYVPQGRRVWPSLSVDEHLRLAARNTRGSWTVARVYETFPRLAERKRNGGSQLSGGEQQMLAIGRALLSNPTLLVMDEPTEGLAPVIVEQVSRMLTTLAHEGEVAVLLIEQNLGVALAVADEVAVMVNGRVARRMPTAELAADAALQQRLLGVKGTDDEAIAEAANESEDEEAPQVFTVRRAGDERVASVIETVREAPATVRGWTRWNAADPVAEASDRALREEPVALVVRDIQRDPAPAEGVPPPTLTGAAPCAYVAGTFDTKGRELNFIKTCIERAGVRVVTVDLSTSGKPSAAQVSPGEVARYHARGAHAVFTGDRGTAVEAMTRAFERFILTRRDVAGLISAGGSGATAMVTPGMRALPIGIPKVMVSTMASGDVKPYVGPADICMMYSVTDVSGINRISERVLANAAHALAGMVHHAGKAAQGSQTKPALGLTMFGVTTPCVQGAMQQLQDDYDCLTFHATGTGGQSMEKLVDSRLLNAVMDITTTEVADELVGGILSAGPERFESIIRTGIPYVGSCGALDMVNFAAMDTVPAQFKGRNLYRHNSNVTLMRTTTEECRQIGEWIVAKLNRMDGPVRFLLPEGGVSMLDAPGKAFWDPAADKALFEAIARGFRASPRRRLIRLPYHVNDPSFIDALVREFRDLLAAHAVAPTGINALNSR